MRLADKRTRRTLSPAQPQRPLVLDISAVWPGARLSTAVISITLVRGRHLRGALRNEDYVAG